MMFGYRPGAGDWLAVVRGDAVLLLPRRDDAAIVELWAALGEADPYGAVLGRFARDGLESMPPFALVVGGAPGGARRVAVRTGCAVVADGRTIRATSETAWLEQTIEADVAWEAFGEGAGGGAGAGGSVWPIREAVVFAAGVRSAEETDAATGAQPSSPPQHTLKPEPEPEPDDAVEDSTIVIDRSALRRPGAAQQPAQAGPTAPQQIVPTSFGGEHDGATVVVSSPAELRREASAHLDRSAQPAAPPAAPQPAPAVRLRLPGGAVEPLAGDVVLGRSPSVNRAAGTRLPRLITLGAGDPDISRSHVRVGLEGGTVVVTDLHSRNGTNVLQPGRPPVKLRPGEPTPVLIGTVVDLGGGWSFAVEAG
ncbi:FHA domain-containing protein [Agromyces larvae]|uniref:FHA domain-containing protein n=1 Tax=Agromyces larvae TaxID=2929802 RepID=A0ABY4C607_9MICO|nr:FHA domain-containing protein [Agromyces larvae]UOE45418.1 FHA domain-containing protein [Agromyces larvae]